MIQRVPVEFAPTIELASAGASAAPGSRMSQKEPQKQQDSLLGVLGPLAKIAGDAEAAAQANAKYQGVIDEYRGEGPESYWNNIFTQESYNKGRAMQASQTGLAKLQASALEDMQAAAEQDMSPDAFLEAQAQKHKAFVAPAMGRLDAQDGMRLLSQSEQTLAASGQTYTKVLSKVQLDRAEATAVATANTAAANLSAMQDDPARVVPTFNDAVGEVFRIPHIAGRPAAVEDAIRNMATAAVQGVGEAGSPAAIRAANDLYAAIQTNQDLTTKLSSDAYRRILGEMGTMRDAVQAGWVSNATHSLRMAGDKLERGMGLSSTDWAAAKGTLEAAQGLRDRNLIKPAQANAVEAAYSDLLTKDTLRIRREQEAIKVGMSPYNVETPRNATDFYNNLLDAPNLAGQPATTKVAKASVATLEIGNSQGNPYLLAKGSQVLAGTLNTLASGGAAGALGGDGREAAIPEASGLEYAIAQYRAHAAGQPSTWGHLRTDLSAPAQAGIRAAAMDASATTTGQQLNTYLKVSSTALDQEVFQQATGVSIKALQFERKDLMGFFQRSWFGDSVKHENAYISAQRPVLEAWAARLSRENKLAGEGGDPAEMKQVVLAQIAKEQALVPLRGVPDTILPPDARRGIAALEKMAPESVSGMVQGVVDTYSKTKGVKVQSVVLGQAGNTLVVRGVLEGSEIGASPVLLGQLSTPDIQRYKASILEVGVQNAVRSEGHAQKATTPSGAQVVLSGKNSAGMSGSVFADAGKLLFTVDRTLPNAGGRPEQYMQTKVAPAIPAVAAAIRELGAVASYDTSTEGRQGGVALGALEERGLSKLLLASEAMQPGGAVKVAQHIRSVRAAGDFSPEADAKTVQFLRTVFPPARVSDEHMKTDIYPLIRSAITRRY